jgi:uncharacterized protein (TIGR00251 family)
MKLVKSAEGVILEVYLKPKSKEFKILVENDSLVVFSHEAPVKGRVNKELVKELSRFFKRRVDIVSGLASPNKRILVRGASVEEVNQTLTSIV